MPDDPLAGGKGWPGMALGEVRGAALAAALVVVTCQRVRRCSRVLAVFARPSRHGQELAGLSRSAAERAADRRPARLVQAGRGRRNDDLAIRCRADAAGNPARHTPSAGRRVADACSVDLSPLVVTLRGDMHTFCASVPDCGIARAPPTGGRAHRGALPADTTRKGGVRDARHVDLTGPGRHVLGMAPRPAPLLITRPYEQGRLHFARPQSHLASRRVPVIPAPEPRREHDSAEDGRVNSANATVISRE